MRHKTTYIHTYINMGTLSRRIGSERTYGLEKLTRVDLQMHYVQSTERLRLLLVAAKTTDQVL